MHERQVCAMLRLLASFHALDATLDATHGAATEGWLLVRIRQEKQLHVYSMFVDGEERELK